MVWLLLACLGVLLLLSVPVAFSIAISVIVYLLADGRFPLDILLQRAIAGVNSFPLLALPLFILAGYLMEWGSTPRLMRLANSLLGFLPGGLAVANVAASALFGAVSGSGVATIAAIGSMMAPEMVRRGYGPGYTAALQAAAGGLGILIPPSVPLIIFGLVGEVSIGALFFAGIFSGLATAFILAVTAMFVAWRNGYGIRGRLSPRDVGRDFLNAIPPLLLPVIILGGIFGGIFTPTEASAVAVLYAFLLSAVVYRELTLERLSATLASTVITSTVILIIIAMSAAFAWIVTINQVPAQIATLLSQVTDSPIVVMILIQCVLLILGVFMETTAIIIITTPIFLPISTANGFDPLLYGVLMIINLIIGSMTPPMAVGIYTSSRLLGIPVQDTIRNIMPFILALLAALLLHIAVPELATYLPRAMGAK